MRTHALAVSLAALVFPILSLPLEAASGRWERIGPDVGDVLALAAPSRPGTIWAGLRHGGVFRSDDRGRTWAPAGGGLGWSKEVTALAVSPTDSETVYALHGSRLFGTKDGGRSWKNLEVAGTWGGAKSFAVHPRDPRILYSGHSREWPMRRSRDGGRTWADLPGSPQDVSVIVIDPADPNVLYAGTWSGGGTFKSTDGGETWTPINAGLDPKLQVRSLLLDPGSPETLYLHLATSDRDRNLFKSTDGGASWTPIGRNVPGSIRLLAVVPGPRGGVYAHLDSRLHRSTDGGLSWSRIDKDLPEFSPLGTGAVLPLPAGLLAGSSEGLFRSEDGGASWTPSGRGLSGNRIAGLAIDPRSSALYAVAQRLGAYKSTDGGTTWNRLPVGALTLDGPVEIAPGKPDTVYMGLGSGIARSDNGGLTWHLRDVPCMWPKILAIDPSVPTTLYVAGGLQLDRCPQNPIPPRCAVGMSADQGRNWTCVLEGESFIPLLAVDPTQPLTVYARSKNILYRTTDGGFAWSPVAENSKEWVLAFDPKSPGTIYAGKAGGVARSTDGGKTWTPRSHGLTISPDEPVIALVLDPKEPSTLYAATSYQGVFKSVDAGATWTFLAPGPQDVRVEFLVLDPRDRATLYVGTSGGGVMRWRQGPTPPPALPP